ncbi:MAG: hypothetical protein A4E61_00273 [Syntrophorhabdus sp. PtaB.Bin184]|nr:MAG: hypothetical protein A4E61_01428 [Syntrophorhabdus sp. PtaB.Bin184]OPY05537.1 MAG: hypothetical protein A4E61_00273 [Syntrophorhabdus sp. PtaB.Bin184]
MEEETSSADAAWTVAPSDTCWEPELICWLAAATLSEAELTPSTTSRSFSTMFFMARRSLPVSSSLFISTSTVRLPSERSLATWTASLRAFFTLRETKKAMQRMTMAQTTVAMMTCHWILFVSAATSST